MSRVHTARGGGDVHGWALQTRDRVPMATYMTLVPFVGAEEAYERATEEQQKW
jgi:hypothetical protein